MSIYEEAPLEFRTQFQSTSINQFEDFKCGL